MINHDQINFVSRVFRNFLRYCKLRKSHLAAGNSTVTRARVSCRFYKIVTGPLAPSSFAQPSYLPRCTSEPTPADRSSPVNGACQGTTCRHQRGIALQRHVVCLFSRLCSQLRLPCLPVVICKVGKTRALAALPLDDMLASILPTHSSATPPAR